MRSALASRELEDGETARYKVLTAKYETKINKLEEKLDKQKSSRSKSI